LATADDELKTKFADFKKRLEEKIAKKDAAFQKLLKEES